MKMNFIPKNKYLLVEKVEMAKREDPFMLPPEYQNKIDPYKMVRLTRVSDTSSDFHRLVGHVLVVPAHAVEEIKLSDEQKVYVVSESLVVGYVTAGEK